MAKILRLNSSIGDVKGVGAKYLQLFEKSGIVSVLDFLLHFPLYYIDFEKISERLELGEKRLYRVEIINWGLSRNWGRRLSVLRVTAGVGDERVSLVFFNKPYLADFFKTHKTALIYGRFEMKNNARQANTPMIYAEDDPDRPLVEPVYSRISTLKSGKSKKLTATIFESLGDEPECLPSSILEKHGFPGVVDALRNIHFPEQFDEESIELLKRRFIYSEFLFFQLELQYIRNVFKQVPRLHNYVVTPQLKASIMGSLPFELTADQKAACETITNDLQGEHTMQRLLQGDVGSGKTIVAFITLSITAASGFQGAFLAPTEILAAQHFSNARRFFTSFNIELLTGSTTAKKRKEILEGLENGGIDILFGTHALLTEDVRFKYLSMVVIDEQHRFGVSQRAALYYKGKSVDLLVTTATPIPRTMLLSLYNDLTVSTIKTKPGGRLPIITKIVGEKRRDEFYSWLRKKLEAGEKAYIILPLIEPSEHFTELRDIETESVYFKKVFKGIPLGIVTGRTPAKEKDELLDGLTRGDIRVLVATTVIEVGIDVKDATFIVIENADRYGLSQLHQLRGRVGRGERQSYCYLFPSTNITESGTRRLETISGTTDGFEIADTDLKMRGGGIISGLQQSGYLDFKVADMKDHLPIFKEAQQDASLLLTKPSLQNKTIKTFLNEIQLKLKEINFS
ncbi:MAG: ATP-dependent DNA helicase RecG [bacterium]|nr:ATP-dependent DNA helicase RecG [bacterium]